MVVVNYGKGATVTFQKQAPVEIKGLLFEDPLNAVKLYQASDPAAAAVVRIDTANVTPRIESLAGTERMLRNPTIYILYSTSPEMAARLKALKPNKNVSISGVELSISKVKRKGKEEVEIKEFGDGKGGKSDARFFLVHELTVP